MLGYIQGGKPYFYRQPTRKHTVETEFDVMNLSALPQVEIAYAHANVGPVAVEALVAWLKGPGQAQIKAAGYALPK